MPWDPSLIEQKEEVSQRLSPSFRIPEFELSEAPE